MTLLPVHLKCRVFKDERPILSDAKIETLFKGCLEHAIDETIKTAAMEIVSANQELTYCVVSSLSVLCGKDDTDCIIRIEPMKENDPYRTFA